MNPNVSKELISAFLRQCRQVALLRHQTETPLTVSCIARWWDYGSMQFSVSSWMVGMAW